MPLAISSDPIGNPGHGPRKGCIDGNTQGGGRHALHSLPAAAWPYSEQASHTQPHGWVRPTSSEQANSGRTAARTSYIKLQQKQRGTGGATQPPQATAYVHRTLSGVSAQPHQLPSLAPSGLGGRRGPTPHEGTSPPRPPGLLRGGGPNGLQGNALPAPHLGRHPPTEGHAPPLHPSRVLRKGSGTTPQPHRARGTRSKAGPGAERHHRPRPQGRDRRNTPPLPHLARPPKALLPFQGASSTPKPTRA